MPTLSRFLGIWIRMHYDELEEPRFHAQYGEFEGQISIIPINVMSGDLPPRIVRLLLAWAEIHKAELSRNWVLASRNLPLRKIRPLK